MSEYTKGPWEVGIGSRCIHVKIGSSEHKVITGDRGNAEANAHLIAAAPDMYEALKEIHDKIDSGEYLRADDPEVDFMIEALDKAEGRE